MGSYYGIEGVEKGLNNTACWQLELHCCGVAHKHVHAVTSVNGKDDLY